MIPFISYDTLFQHYFQFLFNRWKTDVCVTALIADGTLCFPLSTTGDFVPENGFIFINGGTLFIIRLGGREFRFTDNRPPLRQLELYLRGNKGIALSNISINVIARMDFQADHNLPVAVRCLSSLQPSAQDSGHPWRPVGTMFPVPVVHNVRCNRWQDQVREYSP